MLTCLHKGAVVDDFLGQVTLPLNEMDVYERPRQRWYRLEAKPGHEKKDKERGELEVRIAFTVNPETGSTADLSKKSGSRLGLGGSLLSLGGEGGDKRKKMKNFAKSLGSRLHLNGSGKGKIAGGPDGSGAPGDGGSPSSGSVVSVNHPQPRTHQLPDQPKSGQLGGLRGSSAASSATLAANMGSRRPPNADPGVVSDDDDDEDDFVFDNMSHKSSGSSLNVARSNQQLSAGGSSGGLPPPSPLARHANNGVAGAAAAAALDADDVRMRSQTLPAPSKPPRVTPEPVVDAAASVAPPLPTTAAPKVAPVADEWEAKLYGGKQQAGSVDSLKRRSWESSRVIPISVTPPPPATTAETTTAANTAGGGGGSGEHVLASTAPTTPNLEDQKRTVDQLEKPTPLPRSATLESIEEKTAAAATAPAASPNAKEKEKHRLMHKFKYFQRKDRTETAEDMKHADRLAQLAAGRQQQLNERIVVGHENEMSRRNALGVAGGASVAAAGEMGRTGVSPELKQKYDGKTREVRKRQGDSWLIKLVVLTHSILPSFAPMLPCRTCSCWPTTWRTR